MTLVLVVLAVIAVLAVAAAAWMFYQKRRSEQLRAGFGPEYDRAVQTTGDRSKAEQELEARQKRVEALNLRALSPDQRTRFAEAWRQTQAHFVDDPGGAVGEADRLIGEVMQTRGYPVGDFEQRAADISVDHPAVVTNYRAAHRIAGAQARGEASTEDLRQAMVHYRALFEDLLETDTPAQRNGHEEPRNQRQEVRR